MEISADDIRLRGLLGLHGTQLQVPMYQRPYAWTGEQVGDLWDDLMQTAEDKRLHFMGSLVLNTKDDLNPEVIDGRQRLATLLALLAAIRDLYHDLGDLKRSAVLHAYYIQEQGDDYRFKLRLGESNDEFLKNFILREPGDSLRKTLPDFTSLPRYQQQANRHLWEAARFLQTKVREFRGLANRRQAAVLSDLEDVVLNNLVFIAVRVKDIAHAFLIFETLNDRGLDLSAADLLKNLILARAATQDGRRAAVTTLSDQWQQLTEEIGEGDITNFLRHYLLIQHPKVLKEDVFPVFKRGLEGTTPEELLHELSDAGHIYATFVDPTKEQSPQIREVLDDLRTLRARMCYTTRLPARTALSEEEFIRLARLAEILTFRYSTIVGGSAAELERTYHRAAKALAERGHEAYDEACGILRAALPSSEQFKAAFANPAMRRKYVVDYMFRKLEASLSEEKAPLGPAKVHIEHIMPQTLSAEWKRDLGETDVALHADWVDAFGNLTLLGGRRNISASNNSYERKKDQYRQSEINMTRQIPEQ